jgi:hypothetical protein
VHLPLRQHLRAPQSCGNHLQPYIQYSYASLTCYVYWNQV